MGAKEHFDKAQQIRSIWSNEHKHDAHCKIRNELNQKGAFGILYIEIPKKKKTHVKKLQIEKNGEHNEKKCQVV